MANNRDGLNITSMNIFSFPLSKHVIPCKGILSFPGLHVQVYDRLSLAITEEKQLLV